MTKPGILGKAMVNAEFWGVEDSYLERYPSAPRLPEPPQELAQAGYFVRVSSLLPMATLNAVMCDKLVAFAHRRSFKARDKIGRESCRERVCPDGWIWVVTDSI